MSFYKHGDWSGPGAFTTVHGNLHGTPHRYTVVDDVTDTTVGYVYKVEMNVVGACYTHWFAERFPDDPDRRGAFSTRRDAAAYLMFRHARRDCTMTRLSQAADRAREWTVRRDDLIRAEREKGTSLRAIADEVGMSHTAIRRIMERNNGKGKR